MLRRLGEHYAYRADSDNEAQRCWMEVASVDPEDLGVQRELNGIHRRRGDFAALDTALTRQLWRTTDHTQAIEVAREIAQNLDDNLTQPERTVRAWVHVLDLAPNDARALEVLAAKLASKQQSSELHGVLETRLSRAAEDGDNAAQLAIGLQVAADWQARGDQRAAIACYERARAWAPDHDGVLSALLSLHGGDPGAAIAVLEIAASRTADRVRAKRLLSLALPLLPAEAHRARFFLLRRLMRLHDEGDLEQVVQAGTAAQAWRELAAMYESLIRSASTDQAKRAFGLRLAELCETRLNDPGRAYVALQALGLKPMTDDECAALERLAASTGRWEDLLAVLDATLQSGAPPERLHQVLARRAEVCEKQLRDPHRAFLELRRFVEARGTGPLTETEAAILDRMRTLATEHGLMPELSSVYDDLWDLADDDDQRVAYARDREAILRDHLRDPVRALEYGLQVLRMLPREEQPANGVLAAAHELNQWERALPVIEGVWRATALDPIRLVFLANLYDERCNNAPRAVELLAEAVRLDPSSADAQAALERLGDRGAFWPRIVQAMRLAAAKMAGTPRGLELARKVAALYTEKLGDPEASLEVHRWILQVWHDEVASLDVVIHAQRNAGQHADLKASLEQWIEHAPDAGTHVGAWLEIGRLCREHLQDPAGALVAYSNAIELDAANEEAAEAMRNLAEVSLPPALRRKRVRVELVRASGPRRVELLGQLAQLEQETGDKPAAIAALKEMLGTEGGWDLAFERLTTLLRDEGAWGELATMLEDAADRTAQEDAKLTQLREALEVTEAHLNDMPRQERLLRKVLALRADDEEASVRLTRLLRNARRFEELAQELTSRLESSKHDRAAQRWMRRELVRIQDLALGKSKEAEALLRSKPEGETAPDPDDALWLAMMAVRKQDHSTYIEQRRRHIPKLPKRLGGLVLCHLAEYCDQYMKLKGRVLALYREARALDPDNSLATDALRGLGRGVRTWRSTAALLPVPGEDGLGNKDRATRLRHMGDAARSGDVSEALSWYERAVAVDPDDIEAWDSIAAISLERRDTDYAYLASMEAAYAFERVTSRRLPIPTLARWRSALLPRRAWRTRPDRWMARRSSGKSRSRSIPESHRRRCSWPTRASSPATRRERPRCTRGCCRTCPPSWPRNTSAMRCSGADHLPSRPETSTEPARICGRQSISARCSRWLLTRWRNSFASRDNLPTRRCTCSRRCLSRGTPRRGASFAGASASCSRPSSVAPKKRAHGSSLRWSPESSTPPSSDACSSITVERAGLSKHSQRSRTSSRQPPSPLNLRICGRCAGRSSPRETSTLPSRLSISPSRMTRGIPPRSEHSGTCSSSAAITSNSPTYSMRAWKPAPATKESRRSGPSFASASTCSATPPAARSISRGSSKSHPRAKPSRICCALSKRTHPARASVSR